MQFNSWKQEGEIAQSNQPVLNILQLEKNWQ